MRIVCKLSKNTALYLSIANFHVRSHVVGKVWKKKYKRSPVRYVRTRSIYNALKCIALRWIILGNKPRGDDDFINNLGEIELWYAI
jgi:hypothetical protein